MLGRFLAYCFLLSSTLCAGEVDFARDIRPILTENCTECHGGVKAAGGVSFIYRDSVIDYIGDSGNPIVKPGDPEASELIYRITTDDDDDHMPPKDDHPDGLSEREIELLKAWVEQGSPWGEHWSFETPQLPQLPAISNEGWPLNGLDQFVLARLESENVQPSPDAPNYRWLRRASLDLIGLPPTVEEIRDFDGDREAAVDRLLASPRFGERWASVWLDQLRYADSKGLGQDGKRTVWKYRDTRTQKGWDKTVNVRSGSIETGLLTHLIRISPLTSSPSNRWLGTFCQIQRSRIIWLRQRTV